MYIKAAADTELEEFSKKVDCDRKILIATICEKDITDRGKVSWISLGFIMILRYFAQIMLEKKNLILSQWNASHIDHLFHSAHNSAGRIYPNLQRIFRLCYVTPGT